MAAATYTPSEARWLEYIRTRIIGRLEGSPEQRARTAALVSWWALKEGILDLPNPLRHNLCTAAGEQQIGDLRTCPSGPWQIGIAGIQGNVVTPDQVERVAKRLYPGQRMERILERTALEAGVEGNAVDQIRNATGTLRKAWLLRDGPIAFTLQRPFVERGCFTRSASWCFGNWPSARRFASSQERSHAVVAELERFFHGGEAPGDGRALAVTLGALALGGLGYWAWKTGKLAVPRRAALA